MRGVVSEGCVVRCWLRGEVRDECETEPTPTAPHTSEAALLAFQALSERANWLFLVLPLGAHLSAKNITSCFIIPCLIPHFTSSPLNPTRRHSLYAPPHSIWSTPTSCFATSPTPHPSSRSHHHMISPHPTPHIAYTPHNHHSRTPNSNLSPEPSLPHTTPTPFPTPNPHLSSRRTPGTEGPCR